MCVVRGASGSSTLGASRTARALLKAESGTRRSLAKYAAGPGLLFCSGSSIFVLLPPGAIHSNNHHHPCIPSMSSFGDPSTDPVFPRTQPTTQPAHRFDEPAARRARRSHDDDDQGQQQEDGDKGHGAAAHPPQPRPQPEGARSAVFDAWIEWSDRWVGMPGGCFIMYVCGIAIGRSALAFRSLDKSSVQASSTPHVTDNPPPPLASATRSGHRAPRSWA